MADLTSFYQELLELEQWREELKKDKAIQNPNQTKIIWDVESNDTSTR